MATEGERDNLRRVAQMALLLASLPRPAPPAAPRPTDAHLQAVRLQPRGAQLALAIANMAPASGRGLPVLAPLPSELALAAAGRGLTAWRPALEAAGNGTASLASPAPGHKSSGPAWCVHGCLGPSAVRLAAASGRRLPQRRRCGEC